MFHSFFLFFFFFNDTATTEIYTLSLHDALPICLFLSRPMTFSENVVIFSGSRSSAGTLACASMIPSDRKSTRLNSSHGYISYAVFCLKKKKKQKNYHSMTTTNT